MNKKRIQFPEFFFYIIFYFSIANTTKFNTNNIVETNKIG